MNNRTFQVEVPAAVSPTGVVIESEVGPIFGTKISTEAGVLQVWDENPDDAGYGRTQHVTHLYAPGQWLTAIDANFVQ
jgi:hypothetical protein